MKLIRCNNKMNEKLSKGAADHCCLACPASLYPICVRSEALWASGPPFARPVGRVAGWQVSLIVANRTTVYIYSKYWSLRCSHILHNNTTLHWWVHMLPNVVSWTFVLTYHPLHTPHVANHILCTCTLKPYKRWAGIRETQNNHCYFLLLLRPYLQPNDIKLSQFHGMHVVLACHEKILEAKARS